MILDRFNLNEKQLKQFALYQEFLSLENQKYNLTSIENSQDIYIKHFYDSLMLKDVYDLNKPLAFLDIGSGAGFPGIPLKIAFPHLNIALMEPNLKRCNFLEKLIKLLDLDNIQVLNARSEDIKISQRENYDLVSARAVASLPILLELAVPYIKVGGSFLAFKGSSYEDELISSKSAFEQLSVKLINIYNYELPNNYGQRVIINIQKIKKTNIKYPRKYAAIKNKHL